MASRISKSPRHLVCAAFLLSSALFAAESEPAPNQYPTNYNIPLWDEGKVPLSTGDGPLDRPFLTVFLPPTGSANGSSVVLAPGGSNIMLMYGAEGIDIAERYNDWGSTVFVLTYRLSPRYKDDARILDAERAIQLVRSRSAEFHLNPNRVGYIGFSAGGNLGRLLGDASGLGDSNASDPVDRLSSRPGYLALIYGPGRPKPGEPLKDFPPTFLLAAAADTGASLGSAQLFMDLTRAGAIAEIHIYQKGRHGFGSGASNSNLSDWMPRLEHFLKEGGFLSEAKQ